MLLNPGSFTGRKIVMIVPLHSRPFGPSEPFCHTEPSVITTPYGIDPQLPGCSSTFRIADTSDSILREFCAYDGATEAGDRGRKRHSVNDFQSLNAHFTEARSVSASIGHKSVESIHGLKPVIE
jgi:hypothetical protein